eukprot:TRINITY_DN10720_c0_g1_i1.p1 TRINITY_DN10720_c0_g1~~TRINITY_DN10720_c0_g1_i1.p1  ORF type:complete len:205 (+),score=51.92 TRINITY_DN10720_c0_g1_i1:323-937(+)
MPKQWERDITDGVPILVCESVKDYRSAIKNEVTKEDIVLEVGCHEGTTTRLIAEEGCRIVIGIDTSEFRIKRACELLREGARGPSGPSESDNGVACQFGVDGNDNKGDAGGGAGGIVPASADAYRYHGRLSFFLMDALDISAVMKLLPEGERFSKIFVDVSGNRDLSFLIPLLETYEKVFRPKKFIVKNHRLKKLSLQMSVMSS